MTPLWKLSAEVLYIAFDRLTVTTHLFQCTMGLVPVIVGSQGDVYEYNE